MATTTLDFGAFSPAEQLELLTTAKAEYIRRLSGKVQTGSSAAQSYGLTMMTLDEIINLINGLSTSLGMVSVETRVRPNFNTNAGFVPDNNTFGAYP